MIFKLRKLFFVLFIFILFAGFVMFSNDNIVPNININGIDVGKLSKTQALEELKSSIDPLLDDAYLILKYNNYKWKLNYKSLRIVYDYNNAIDNAYALGRDGNILHNKYDYIRSQLSKHEIAMNFTLEKKTINNFLRNIAKQIHRNPINPTIRFTKGEFVITDGEDGIKLDTDEAINTIIKNISITKISTITLPTIPIEPEYKKEVLKNIKDELGAFTTTFKAFDTNRVSNIKIATQSANNIVIMPNEIFSLNKVLGPVLEKYGYKLANVVINNELVPGIGGGICQVSSTLYNAVLLSNLKIVERKNHTLPSTYVDMGRDATISGNYIDFKFQNNTKYPLYIYGEVKKSSLSFTIYGKNDYPNREVKIKTQILSVINPKVQTVEDISLEKGLILEDKKPRPGYIVKSFREVFEKGKKLYVETLFTDKYPATNGLRRLGINN